VGEACRAKGIVVVPISRSPGRDAAAIVAGKIDGVEMTSLGRLYTGINPYSLSDWYRYLNSATSWPVGARQMSADTAIGRCAPMPTFRTSSVHLR